MVKHLSPRTPEELDNLERTLFSGKIVKELLIEDIIVISRMLNTEWRRRCKEKQKILKSSFRKFQFVKWNTSSGPKTGHIVRLNPKTATIVISGSTIKHHIFYEVLIPTLYI